LFLFALDFVVGSLMITSKTVQYFANWGTLRAARVDPDATEADVKAWQAFSTAYFFYMFAARHFYLSFFLEFFEIRGVITEETYPNLHRASSYFYGSAEGSSWITFWMLLLEANLFVEEDKWSSSLKASVDLEYQVGHPAISPVIDWLFLLLLLSDFMTTLPDVGLPFFGLIFVTTGLAITAEEAGGTFGENSANAVAPTFAVLLLFVVVPMKLHMDFCDRRKGGSQHVSEARCFFSFFDSRAWTTLLSTFFYTSFYTVVLDLSMFVHFWTADKVSGRTFLGRVLAAAEHGYGNRISKSGTCDRSEEIDKSGVHVWYRGGVGGFFGRCCCCCCFGDGEGDTSEVDNGAHGERGSVTPLAGPSSKAPAPVLESLLLGALPGPAPPAPVFESLLLGALPGPAPVS